MLPALLYGSGCVEFHSYLMGMFPDGLMVHILGIYVVNAGGHIVCRLNKVSNVAVSIFARSITVSTKIHVYISSRAC